MRRGASLHLAASLARLLRPLVLRSRWRPARAREPLAQARRPSRAAAFASPEEAVAGARRRVRGRRHQGAARRSSARRPRARDRPATGRRSQRRETLRRRVRRGAPARAGGGKIVLYVGADDFPFPIPLVPDGPAGASTRQAGQEEILNRRIGRNELNTIQVCLAYVDAQREYYAARAQRRRLLEYAQRFASTPGKRDGLYWDAKAGEKPSPLGPLAARARGRGLPAGATGPTPYHGYYYRILTARARRARTARTTTSPAGT